MDNSNNSTNNTTNNVFNLATGSSVSLSFVIQGSQSPEAQRLTALEKAAIGAMIERAAADTRRVYNHHLNIESQLEGIAARLRIL